MAVIRDAQTVDPSGRRLDPLPEGMVLRELVTHTDARGTVCELYDPRWGANPDPLVYAYMCTIRPGMSKGWGVHREHEDRYAFLTGELELAFHDGRENSSTASEDFRVVLSELHRSLLVIPRGVWHAERNLGSTDARVRQLPDHPLRPHQPWQVPAAAGHRRARSAARA